MSATLFPDEAEALILIGNAQPDARFGKFAPLGAAVVIRLAVEHHQPVHIVEPVKATAQAIVARPEQLAVQPHIAQPNISLTGDHKLLSHSIMN